MRWRLWDRLAARWTAYRDVVELRKQLAYLDERLAEEKRLREAADRELYLVDLALGNRRAFDDFKLRADKIAHAIASAKQGDELAGDLRLARIEADNARRDAAVLRGELDVERARAATRIAELERRCDSLVADLTALRREGFERPPEPPSPDAVAPIELPAKVREAIGVWPNDSVLRRQIQKYAVDQLRAGQHPDDLAAKIAQGESLDDLLE